MKSAYQTNTVRIIAGQFRGRKIHFTATPQLRPTGDRIRETLFNWLSPHLPGSRCLDLFAGSGILGLEALSRGADFVSFVDSHREATVQLKLNADKLSCTQLEIRHQDAMKFLKETPAQPYSIVFLDPPFNQDLLEQCAALLENHDLLTPQALVYLESEFTLTTLTLPDTWKIIREQKAGHVIYRLAQRIAAIP